MDKILISELETLSKLKISDSEKEKLSKQLSEIIDYFNILGELDTDSTGPADTFGALVNVLRADEVKPSLSPNVVTACAHDTENSAFCVPKTVEQEG